MSSWIIVLIILIAAVGAAIMSIVKEKKPGKCSCGHNCGACAQCGKCGGNTCAAHRK